MEIATTALGFLMSGTGAAVLGAGASIYQGYQASEEAKAQADTAKQNAEIARKQAGAREELIRRHNRQKLSEQRAAAAQTGFNPNAGSLLELQGESAGNLELDALTARYEGQLQSLSFENEARNMRRKARGAATSGLLNAAGSLLGSPLGKRYGSQSLAPVETRALRG